MSKVILLCVMGGEKMFELYKKVAWTGVAKSTISEFVKALVRGNDIWTAISVAGLALGGGVASAVAAVGRAAIVKFVKRWGIKKAVAW